MPHGPPSPGAKSWHLEMSSFPSCFSYTAGWKMNSLYGSSATFKGSRSPTFEAWRPCCSPQSRGRLQNRISSSALTHSPNQLALAPLEMHPLQAGHSASHAPRSPRVPFPGAGATLGTAQPGSREKPRTRSLCKQLLGDRGIKRCPTFTHQQTSGDTTFQMRGASLTHLLSITWSFFPLLPTVLITEKVT